MSEKTINRRAARIEDRLQAVESQVGQPVIGCQAGEAPRSANQSKAPWYKTLDGWRRPLELVAFIFAIGYAIVTFLQWRDLQLNFRQDERAWVVVDQTHVTIDGSKAPPVHVELTLQNVGKTPALHVTVKSSMQVDQPSGGFMVSYPATFDIPLAPNQRHVIDLWPTPAPQSAFPQFIQELQSGVATLKVSADVSYIDIFKHSHHTVYCGVYDPRVSAFGFYKDCARSMD